MNDLRFALRSLSHARGFTLVAVLTLALGLSVNITIFGMLNEFFLRPLPVRDPHQLVFVMQRNPQLIDMPFPLSYPDFLDLRQALDEPGEQATDAAQVFAGLLAYLAQPAHLSQGDRWVERAWIHEVSDNYFDVLGVAAARGRVFLPQEGKARGADPVAVLTHHYWIERFGANPDAIGQVLHINGAPFTIIGVTPEGFGGAEALSRASVFVPAMMADQLRPQATGAIAARGNTSYLVMARLQPTVTVPGARAVMDGLLQQLIERYPDEHAPATAVVLAENQSRPSPFVSRFAPPAIAALMILALLVLAVAAANVANLLFARAAQAERSLAIRSSLGASRWRLIRQLLAESILLALGAAVVGWFASDAFSLGLQHLTASQDAPPPTVNGPDWRLFAFTFVAAVVTGVATGLIPALRATRLDVLPLLKDTTPLVSRTRHPWRSLLVVGQVAISCLVLVGAGLALRSLQVLAHVNPGFRAENVLLATFDLAMQRYSDEQARQFQKTLLDEVRALPGVTDASLARTVPFDLGFGLEGGIGAEGQPPPDRDNLFTMGRIPVSPRFLETLGVRLLAGRSLTEDDRADAPPVAVISQAVAQRFWPDQDPIGKRLAFHNGQRLVEVVGLVDDIRYLMLTDRNRPLIFLPIAQDPSANVTLAVRTMQSPPLLTRSIEQIVRRLDPGLPTRNVRTLEEQVERSPLGLMVFRFGTVIAATQGLLVLLLSVMGLYGLVSFAVARRTREIGIRLALGASARQVLVPVIRPSLILAGTGLLMGMLLAAAAALPLAGLLYGIRPHDVMVFGGVTLLIIAVTALAAWLPARRALRINPVDALRAE
jgi:predicted permease